MIHINASNVFVVLSDRTEVGNLSGLDKTATRKIKRDTIKLPEINVISSFDYQTRKIGYYEKGFFDLRRKSIQLGSYYNAICIQFEGGHFTGKIFWNLSKSMRRKKIAKACCSFISKR